MSESSTSDNILAVTVPIAVVLCTIFFTKCTQHYNTASNEPAKQAEITIEAIQAGLVQDEKGHWVKPTHPVPQPIPAEKPAK